PRRTPPLPFQTPSPPTLSTLSLHDALPIYNRSREAELDATTAPDTRAEAGSARVEQHRHIELDRRRVQVVEAPVVGGEALAARVDRKSTRLNSSHVSMSYAVFCLKKKKKI